MRTLAASLVAGLILAAASAAQPPPPALAPAPSASAAERPVATPDAGEAEAAEGPSRSIWPALRPLRRATPLSDGRPAPVPSPNEAEHVRVCRDAVVVHAWACS